MPKNQRSNKETKKQPLTSFKEKRAARKAKQTDVKGLLPSPVARAK